MERGDLRAASDRIARYEQRQIVQPIYDCNQGTFAWMERANTAGRLIFMGASRDISVAYNCNNDNPVDFTGSPSNPNDRVRYYERLRDQMYRQGASRGRGEKG